MTFAVFFKSTHQLPKMFFFSYNIPLVSYLSYEKVFIMEKKQKRRACLFTISKLCDDKHIWTNESQRFYFPKMVATL